MKTNAARFLDGLGIAFEMREYEVDPEDVSAIAVAWLGVGFGVGERVGRDWRWRAAISWSVAFLVSAVVAITLDLDSPRQGLIRVDQRPRCGFASKALRATGAQFSSNSSDH